MTPLSSWIIQGSTWADTLNAKVEKDEAAVRAADAGVAPSVARKLNKAEQVPGRKGVSSKLDAIREKYNPGEDGLSAVR